MIRWTIKNTVPSTARVVTLAEARSYLRMNDGETGQDAHIEQVIIPAATGVVEAFIGRQLLTGTWRLRMSRFPAGRQNAILLPMPPVQSVVITYLDSAGTSQTLSASDYTVNTDAEPAAIERAYNVNWPTIRADQYNSVTVTYVAGYGDSVSAITDTVFLADMKRAILGVSATLYEFREDLIVGTIRAEIPEAAERLLWPWRSWFDKPWRT